MEAGLQDDSFIKQLRQDDVPKSAWEKMNENPEQKIKLKRETLSETNLKDLEQNKPSNRQSLHMDNDSLNTTLP